MFSISLSEASDEEEREEEKGEIEEPRLWGAAGKARGGELPPKERLPRTLVQDDEKRCFSLDNSHNEEKEGGPARQDGRRKEKKS
jgi:hypothetical protein